MSRHALFLAPVVLAGALAHAEATKTVCTITVN